jgi:hypothetical protein
VKVGWWEGGTIKASFQRCDVAKDGWGEASCLGARRVPDFQVRFSAQHPRENHRLATAMRIIERLSVKWLTFSRCRTNLLELPKRKQKSSSKDDIRRGLLWCYLFNDYRYRCELPRRNTLLNLCTFTPQTGNKTPKSCTVKNNCSIWT